MTLKTLRKEVCEANRNLEKHGLSFLEKGGVSGIDRAQGVVIVKPAEIPHTCLTPEDMLVLDLTGKLVEGSLTPGLDVTAHLFLYQAFRDICGIANTYGPYATMFAQAERPIPCMGVVHARYFKGEIPVTRALRKPEIERNYERSMGAVIVERFSRMEPDDMPGVLVAHHGAFTWAKTPSSALVRSIAMEKVARIAFGTLQLMPQAAAIPNMLSEKHFTAE